MTATVVAFGVWSVNVGGCNPEAQHFEKYHRGTIIAAASLLRRSQQRRGKQPTGFLSGVVVPADSLAACSFR